MGTEVAISFSTLRAQLENEKSSLCKIDENIKKIVQTNGRFQNDRFNNGSGDFGRGGPRLGGRNSFPESSNSFRNDEQLGKRKHETKTVFSRLSARTHDSDGEEEVPGKRARMPSAVCRELPTRAAVLRAQGDDEQARTRNRRIFGSLLGTLQKFKQEEIVLQTKEDKKAQVERKIEEQARQLKEKEQKERKTLFADREHKKATIKALEAKMARVQEFEKWEESQRHLGNFILTKVKPHLYWLPKKMTEKAEEKLTSSRKFHEKCMSRKRQELQDELQRIEQRCLRPKGPGAKENDPENVDHKPETTCKVSESSEQDKDDGARKRDKFAMDVDENEKEDSDNEDRHVKSDKDEIKSEEVESQNQEVESKNQEVETESQEIEKKSQEIESKSQEDESQSQEDESQSEDVEPKIEKVSDEVKAETPQENTNETIECKDDSQIAGEITTETTAADVITENSISNMDNEVPIEDYDKTIQQDTTN